MMNRAWLTCGGLLALALGAALALSACSSKPKRPKNVLLLVLDTLRADRLGCYGYSRDTSPNIDRLAAEGTLYEHNYSQACWTVPSMISMLSGVSVTKDELAVPVSISVLAEVLSRHGMETAAFAANAVLGNQRGFERGFSTWDKSTNLDAQQLAERFALWHGARAEHGNKSKPWFAWMQFIDPHQPYEPKPVHDRFRGPRPDQALLEARWSAAQQEASERSPNLDGLALQAAIDHMTQQSNLYDGEVFQTDDGVGRVLATLRAAGELDDTLVILVSDHGVMLFDHRVQPYLVNDKIDTKGGLPDGVADLFGNVHRPWYFENLWNKPMFLSGPGMPKGRRVSSLCANLDVYPTVLEALDFPRAPWLEGESLFGGATTTRDRVLAYGYFTSAVRDKNGLKLIAHPRRLFLLEGEGDGPAELYDLPHDPHEDSSLARQRPEDVARMRAEIQAWKEACDREAVLTSTPAQQEALRAMGYVELK
jgi:arylsulfatase A-like enzyme